MKIKEIAKLITGTILFFMCIYALYIWMPKKIELDRNSGVSVGEIWMYNSGMKIHLKKKKSNSIRY